MGAFFHRYSYARVLKKDCSTLLTEAISKTKPRLW